MKSAPGEGPEAELIKNDRFYKLFGFTIAKYTAKTMLLQLFRVSKRPPGGAPGPPFGGPWVGPKHNISLVKQRLCWFVTGPKTDQNQEIQIKQTESQQFRPQIHWNTITHNDFSTFLRMLKPDAGCQHQLIDFQHPWKCWNRGPPGIN